MGKLHFPTQDTLKLPSNTFRQTYKIKVSRRYYISSTYQPMLDPKN